jgi:hypothetical protein
MANDDPQNFIAQLASMCELRQVIHELAHHGFLAYQEFVLLFNQTN